MHGGFQSLTESPCSFCFFLLFLSRRVSVQGGQSRDVVALNNCRNGAFQRQERVPRCVLLFGCFRPDRLDQCAPVMTSVVAQSLSRSVAQSLSRSVAQSLSRSVAQSLSRSVAQSLSRSVAHRNASTRCRGNRARSQTRSADDGGLQQPITVRSSSTTSLSNAVDGTPRSHSRHANEQRSGATPWRTSSSTSLARTMETTSRTSPRRSRRRHWWSRAHKSSWTTGRTFGKTRGNRWGALWIIACTVI